MAWVLRSPKSSRVEGKVPADGGAGRCETSGVGPRRPSLGRDPGGRSAFLSRSVPGSELSSSPLTQAPTTALPQHRPTAAEPVTTDGNLNTSSQSKHFLTVSCLPQVLCHSNRRLTYGGHIQTAAVSSCLPPYLQPASTWEAPHCSGARGPGTLAGGGEVCLPQVLPPPVIHPQHAGNLTGSYHHECLCSGHSCPGSGAAGEG